VAFRRQDLSGADVVFCYLLPDSRRRLEAKLDAEMKKGAPLEKPSIEYQPRIPVTAGGGGGS